MINLAEWPTDKTKRRIIFHDHGPDERGRRLFDVLWWAPDNGTGAPVVDGMTARGQGFFSANIPQDCITEID